MSEKFDLGLIQTLRERTGVGMMDCKKALVETGGDIDRAVELLRKKGAAVAEKRAGNATKQGLVVSYIHAGSQIGVLVEISCETDFVARTPDLEKFARDVAMQIAAVNPRCVNPSELDAAFVEREKDILSEQLKASGKPAAMLEKILAGKLEKLYTEVCLMQQTFIKNDKLTIDDLLKDLIAKMGEKITVRRFVRFEVGV
ncbi:MAG: Elongation factor Ts [candidate division TM6 bacterium GW2011_GWE2_42_60]|nr:MAG: Elongation factor Ts [candidate division TM6 bacterium GW2011_GWE2_42_60]HBY06096.1 elongation factor Ts [Candidatus Dependentiae bacterium]